jgi:hypothetical protein
VCVRVEAGRSNFFAQDALRDALRGEYVVEEILLGICGAHASASLPMRTFIPALTSPYTVSASFLMFVSRPSGADAASLLMSMEGMLPHRSRWLYSVTSHWCVGWLEDGTKVVEGWSFQGGE